jgi:hypothetical protein
MYIPKSSSPLLFFVVGMVLNLWLIVYLEFPVDLKRPGANFLNNGRNVGRQAQKIPISSSTALQIDSTAPVYAGSVEVLSAFAR